MKQEAQENKYILENKDIMLISGCLFVDVWFMLVFFRKFKSI